MTVPQFSRPGAIDLSALRRPAGRQPGGPARGGPGQSGGGYAFDVTGEQQLTTDVLERSMSVVVLVSFWSDQVPASTEINQTLEALSDEFGGRFLLARVDVGTQPDLAQALGIPQVPLVVAALRGQLAPLIQELLPVEQMRSLLDQVIQAAVSNGVNGVADPLTPRTDDPPEEPVEPETRHPEAEAALLANDFDGAVAAYQQALAAAPGDPEAREGLARAELLKRATDADPAVARADAAERPDDVTAQILVADLDLMGGHVEDAFSRLIDLVRRTRDAERETTRQHLLQLFLVVGEADPRVATARQALASALF